MDPRVLKKKINKFNSARQKFQQDNEGLYERDRSLTEFHKPVTTVIKEQHEELKGGVNKAVEVMNSIANYSLPAIENTRENLSIEELKEKITSAGPLALQYLASRNDPSFGVTFNTDDLKFYFGGEPLEIVGDNFKFQNKDYEGTRGLWELLTQKEPEFIARPNGETYFKNVLSKDKHAYLEMIESTGIHLKDGHPRSNKGTKWVSFIGPWYLKKKQESGSTRNSQDDDDEVFETPGPKIPSSFLRNVTQRRKHPSAEEKSHSTGNGFRFLDPDPNRLIDKLYTLVLNVRSGHTIHSKNEMAAISQKLYQDNIICHENYLHLSKFIDTT